MKRILVPIDFSDNSVFALQVAVGLSNELNSALRIIHVQTGQQYAPEFLGDNPEERIIGQARQWLEHLVKKFLPDYKVHNGEFDYKVREGNVVREITNQARYDDASLIVVGTHGISGVEEKWLGSNAYRLVSHAPCPVLTVRKGMRWENPHKVLLPIDYHKLARKIVPVVAGFAKLLKAEVSVVALQKKSKWLIPGRSNIYARQAERYIQNNTSLKVSVTNFNWQGDVKNIMTFAREQSASVIAIHLIKSTNPFESFFRPFANEILNTSDIPVLIVPVKE